MLILFFLAVLVPGIPVDEQPHLPPPPPEFDFEEVEASLLPVITVAKQEALADLGWYEGEVDGIHGPLTERAVEEFTDAAEVEPEDWLDLLEALRGEGAPKAPEPDPVPQAPTSSVQEVRGRYGVPEPWATLAECESGNWIDGGASFERGSARWHWAKPGTAVPPWGTSIHHGGLQTHPDTWNWVAPMVGLGNIDFAYNATPQEQVRVAEKILELQGFQAWPTCSRKLGLR